MIVHNDFHKTHGLFPLFDGLEVEGLNDPYEVNEAMNGVPTINGGDNPVPACDENQPLTNGQSGSH
jgi:methylenetetrahydrofolate reductase (NADPH)